MRRLKAHQFPEDAGPLAHPVRPETYREINNFYTTTVYEKGAELVRMIATILGEEKFRKGMALYLKRHDGDAATIEDFVACFEQAGKIELSQFSLWYSQAGTPTLSISTTYDKPKRRMIVEVEQATSPTPGQARKLPMHIPQKIALIGPNGCEIEPSLITGTEVSNGVFHLTKRKHKLQFEGVDQRAVLSINRGFTAPVEIDYRQSPADLSFLAGHDSDAYNRWQAYQDYATRLLVSASRAIQSGKSPEPDQRFLDTTLEIATNETLEPAFRASILTLPGEGDLAQTINKNVNPDAIHKARTSLLASIGKILEPIRVDLSSSMKTPGAYDPRAEDAGKRNFKNLLLALSVAGGSTNAEAEAIKQFSKAKNMTDRFAAFQLVTHMVSSVADRNQVVEAFYKRYSKNHLVLDKWFSAQATRPGAGTAKAVRKLTRHHDFSLKNPNRTRSLIGAFASANPSGFNAVSGEGYKLVSGTIAKLDRINPQVAARMLTSFRSFRSLEPERRKLAANALKELRSLPDLSRDVMDILDRTLG